MLILNEKYVINNGQGSIVFTEGNKGTVNAVYTIRGNKSEGKINGTLDGNLLKGTFHVDAAAGLIEFTFNSNGFDAKWKQGLEPGPMRGKWNGSLNNELLIEDNEYLFNAATDKFIEFIKNDYSLNSAYEGVIGLTTDFVEDFSLEFEDDFFGDLKTELDVVVFNVDNSEESIDEHDGSDSFTIYYDFKNNCIYKHDPNQDDEYYCFLNSWHASMSNYYKENKKFLGSYSMSDLNNNWHVRFHGDFESASGDIDENLTNKIKENINSTAFYTFIDEVLDCM
jgi:hypothetical protein